MARRRVISSAMLVDEEFNSLSMEAQILFLRMLCISDDYGVVPANPFQLAAMINPSEEIRKNLEAILYEIIDQRLGFKIQVENKPYFIFKPNSFKHWQAQLLSRRAKSEYLRMAGEEVLELFAQQLQVHLEDLGRQAKTSNAEVESRKQKAESKEKRVASREHQAEDDTVSLKSSLLGSPFLAEIQRQHEEDEKS
jgi:hypothetical protein